MSWMLGRTGLVALTLSPFSLCAQKNVPIVNLPPASAVSSETIGGVLGLRQVASGEVLVNDGVRRQIKLFDSTLAASTIVLDSTPGLTNSYGSRPVPLAPYLGDSSLFTDVKSRTVLVFDSRGQIARSIALPTGVSVARAMSGVDNRGRLIYLGSRVARRPIETPTGFIHPDSVLVMRADLDLRRVDTIGFVSRPLARATGWTKADNGTTYSMTGIDPLKPVDEWSVLSDGSVAFVRGQDYHIDWIHPDGTMSSTAKMPFDWKRLSDAEKVKLVDSTRAAINAQLASDTFQNESIMMTGDGGHIRGPEGGGAGDGGGRVRSGGGGGEVIENPIGRTLSQKGRGFLPHEAEVIPLNQVADYYPAIRLGATMPDLDGHLWILPTTSAQSQHGELVYDVVNAKGDLFQRVRLPSGRSIAGFGKGGVVYLIAGDKTNGFHLERTRVP